MLQSVEGVLINKTLFEDSGHEDDDIAERPNDPTETEETTYLAEENHEGDKNPEGDGQEMGKGDPENAVTADEAEVKSPDQESER